MPERNLRVVPHQLTSTPDTAEFQPAAFDYVVEATGSSAGLESVLRMVLPRRTIILKSTVHDRASIDWARVIVNEITLIGFYWGRFEPALKLLSEHRVEVRSLITERFPLAEAPAAFERPAQSGSSKYFSQIEGTHDPIKSRLKATRYGNYGLTCDVSHSEIGTGNAVDFGNY